MEKIFKLCSPLCTSWLLCLDIGLHCLKGDAVEGKIIPHGVLPNVSSICDMHCIFANGRTPHTNVVRKNISSQAGGLKWYVIRPCLYLFLLMLHSFGRNHSRRASLLYGLGY